MGVFNFPNFFLKTNPVLPTTFDDTLSYYEVLGKVVSYLNEISNDMNKLANSLVLPYDTDTTYSPGDYCWYNDKLYKAILFNHGLWNDSAWEEVVFTDSISDDFNNFKNTINNYTDVLTAIIKSATNGIAKFYDENTEYTVGDYCTYIPNAEIYDRNNSYQQGDYCIYDKTLYKCIENAGNETFNPNKWEIAIILYKCTNDTTGEFDPEMWENLFVVTELKEYIDELWSHWEDITSEDANIENNYILPNNTNIDNIYKSGYYFLSTSENRTYQGRLPVQSPVGYLLSLRNGESDSSSRFQMFIEYGVGAILGKTYYRTKPYGADSSWNDWVARPNYDTTMENYKILDNGSNINTLTKSGWYYLQWDTNHNYLPTDSMPTNEPNGYLLNLPFGNAAMQVFINYRSGDSLGNTYIRRKYVSSGSYVWSNWITKPDYTNTLINYGVLQNGENINTLTKSGWYHLQWDTNHNYLPADSMPTNEPNGYLLNLPFGNAAMQVFINYRSGSDLGNTYVRRKYYSSGSYAWSNWVNRDNANMKNGYRLANNTNIDNIWNNGIYYLDSSYNYNGSYPCKGASGFLFNLPYNQGSNVSTLQLFYIWDNTNRVGMKFARRRTNGSAGSWTRWVQIDAGASQRNFIKASVSFLDDDTENEESVKYYHDLFQSNGLKCGYACIPYNFSGPSNENFKKRLLEYEADGYSCLLHCYYQNRYELGANHYNLLTSEPYDFTSDYNKYFYLDNGEYKPLANAVSWAANTYYERNMYYSQAFINGSTRDLYICGENLMAAIKAMREMGFINYKYWVIPYSATDNDIVNLAKELGLECAFTRTDAYNNPTYNNDYYQIKRYGIDDTDVEADYENGNTANLDLCKEQIDTCIANNGWLIFETHVATWGEPNSAKRERCRAFVQNVIDYCNSKTVPIISPLRGIMQYKNIFGVKQN